MYRRRNSNRKIFRHKKTSIHPSQPKLYANANKNIVYLSTAVLSNSSIHLLAAAFLYLMAQGFALKRVDTLHAQWPSTIQVPFRLGFTRFIYGRRRNRKKERIESAHLACHVSIQCVKRCNPVGRTFYYLTFLSHRDHYILSIYTASNRLMTLTRFRPSYSLSMGPTTRPISFVSPRCCLILFDAVFFLFCFVFCHLVQSFPFYGYWLKYISSFTDRYPYIQSTHTHFRSICNPTGVCVTLWTGHCGVFIPITPALLCTRQGSWVTREM